MTNIATLDLIEEHGGIMLMLSIMGEVANRLKRDENVEKEHLIKIEEFVISFADKCHHGKEEGILFPELIKHSPNPHLINELLGEHKTGRDYIRGISESLENYQPGNPEAIHIAVNIDGYINLLTEHIRKENEVLFPQANSLLSDAEQSTIGEQYEKLEHDVIGVGKHEEYHGWLQELKDIYLP